MDIKQDVLTALDRSLNLNGRAQAFNLDTPLLGALAELDSMAVIELLRQIENQFDLVIEDDEVSGAIFLSVGALVSFVEAKIKGA